MDYEVNVFKCSKHFFGYGFGSCGYVRVGNESYRFVGSLVGLFFRYQGFLGLHAADPVFVCGFLRYEYVCKNCPLQPLGRIREFAQLLKLAFDILGFVQRLQL